MAIQLSNIKKSPDCLYTRLLYFALLGWHKQLENPSLALHLYHHKIQHISTDIFHYIITHKTSSPYVSAGRRHLHFIISPFGVTDLFYRCLFAIYLHWKKPHTTTNKKPETMNKQKNLLSYWFVYLQMWGFANLTS